MTRSRWILLGGIVVAGSLGAGWFAHAAIDNSKTWGTIPYRGHLELNGAVQDTPVDLALSLWDAPSGGSKLWEETQSGVAVTSGDFAVTLGAATPLNQAVERAPGLYLVVGVRTAGTATFEALLGRQALRSVPFALAAKRGVPTQEFAADGLKVEGDAGITGQLSVGSGLTVAGPIRADGGLQADFDSRWFAAARGENRSFTHGLGVQPTRFTVLVSANPTGEPAHVAGDTWKNVDGEFRRGVLVTDVTSTTLVVRTGREPNCGIYDTFGMGDVTAPRVCLPPLTGPPDAYVRVLAWK